jgi:hypothetical protein
MIFERRPGGPMSSTVPASPESVFTHGAPLLKFGPGASDEIGFELSQYGVRRALIVTDPGVAATGIPARSGSRSTPARSGTSGPRSCSTRVRTGRPGTPTSSRRWSSH